MGCRGSWKLFSSPSLPSIKDVMAGCKRVFEQVVGSLLVWPATSASLPSTKPEARCLAQRQAGEEEALSPSSSSCP